MQSNRSLRPWREIAEEVLLEKDANKILQLTMELNAALDAQRLGLGYPQEPTAKPKSPER